MSDFIGNEEASFSSMSAGRLSFGYNDHGDGGFMDDAGMVSLDSITDSVPSLKSNTHKIFIAFIYFFGI